MLHSQVANLRLVQGHPNRCYSVYHLLNLWVRSVVAFVLYTIFILMKLCSGSCGSNGSGGASNDMLICGFRFIFWHVQLVWAALMQCAFYCCWTSLSSWLCPAQAALFAPVFGDSRPSPALAFSRDGGFGDCEHWVPATYYYYYF